MYVNQSLRYSILTLITLTTLMFTTVTTKWKPGLMHNTLSDHSYFNRWFGDSMKVQYNSLTMLLSSFMQEFGPISSHVYCIFAQIYQ
jgi:hypothetical protein